MYRVSKVLNHNGLIAIDMEDDKEYLLLGKGVGFGKKVSERLEKPEDCTIYSMTEKTDRGNAKDLVKSVEPEFLEISNNILNMAEAQIGSVDRGIIFPMADHIAFATERMKKNEQIRNPLTDDIKILFHNEFKIASTLKETLKETKNIDVSDDEIGYVALHIHSALDSESVSISMQMAGAVRECVTLIEEKTGKNIDIMSISYNRLMNHVKYMVARLIKGEHLKVSMNDYVEHTFPESFELAVTICDHLSNALGKNIEELEVGYLAMHIERVCAEA